MDCHSSSPSLKKNNATESYPPRVIVMGAGGFVGRHLLRSLTGKCDVLALTRKEMDLLQPTSGEKLASILQEGDTLVVTSALAPCKSGEMLIDNLKMMEQVCRAISQKKLSQLLYVSSDAVYRDSKHRITESFCAQPDSFHGVMHLAREVMLKNSFPGPFAIVRPTLIYGADDPHNGYGPNKFARLAKTNQKISLFGKGEELRDHIAVEDVVEIIRLVIAHQCEGVVNAVSGKEITFNEIAQLAKKLSNSSSEIQENPRTGPMPHNGLRAFDPLGRRDAFPTFECRPLESGLQEMIQKIQ